jgi:hypothetical protein
MYGLYPTISKQRINFIKLIITLPTDHPGTMREIQFVFVCVCVGLKTNIQVIELERISHFTTKHKELDVPYLGLINQQYESLDTGICIRCQVDQAVLYH